MNKSELIKLSAMLNDPKFTTEGQKENVLLFLDEQLRLENAKSKGSTAKKQYTTATKFLKGISENRPILKYVDYQDGRQVFTDSFVAFMMINHIEGLPYHDNQNGTYPSLSEFVPKVEDCQDVTELFNYTDVLMKSDKMKIDKAKTIYSKDHCYMINGACLNPNLVKMVIDVLADDIANIKVYFKGDMRPVLFTNSKGDQAIVVPVRIN